MQDESTITVPPFGMGCVHIANTFAMISEAESIATLSAAWDAGVRYYDTAPWYGNGLSELRLGALLRDRPRDEFVLSTKVGRVYDPLHYGPEHKEHWKAPVEFDMRYDYTAQGFEQSLVQSRLRMGIGKIDALIIHDLDRRHHGDAMAGHVDQLMGSGQAFLHGLRKAGDIGLVGMGINATEDFAFFVDKVDVDFFLVAMPYTLLDQAALHGPMRRCIERGIGVIIGAPFASGLLADHTNANATYGYAAAADDKRRKAAAIAAVCTRHDVPIRAAALQFPMLHPAVISIIPGAMTPEQVIDNAANARRPIPGALWRDLREEGLIDPDAPIGGAV